ncbi:endo alpha-1,4 polygalactosaminidase [Pseudoalteromonas ruthenica]|uniref:endo alpha-1,4 polygalactosaminidase n=1 Tax=Pseudoalteromonas ruthenica TaxID=151081 RepID=UPI0014861C1A|nr:endo alpha-1,4 polygalactosaminidase [Pseudoalteromonas ruthenica]
MTKCKFVFTVVVALLVSGLIAQPTRAVAPTHFEQSIAFYYGEVDSVRELISYQRVVVSPQQLSKRQLQQLKNANTQVYAYLSVGEYLGVDTRLLDAASMGRNSAWQAEIMDAASPVWRQHLQQQAERYQRQGFSGVFLDTLDSYQLALPHEQHASQQQALVSLIDNIATSLPVMLNRGFELVDKLAQPPQAVVAESLMYGFDITKNDYTRQSDSDIQWLRTKLEHIEGLGIEAIVIDYLPAGVEARVAAAKEIAALGFTPYVSDGLLQQFGVSLHYPVRRRVLGVYDSSVVLKKQSACHKYLATLIEYQGYVPQCIDIRDSRLAQLDLERFAGVAFWLPQASYQHLDAQQLLLRSISQRPTVIIGELPDDEALLARLGIRENGSYTGALESSGAKLTYPMPHAAPKQFPRYQLMDSHTPALVSINDSQGNTGVGVARMPWGGLFLEPLTVQELIGDRNRWPLEPFAHLIPLFSLAAIPVPDVTTESGLRIVTAHIDGDGFPSVAWLPGRPYAGASILNNVLKKSPLPHTVSVVEAEVAPHGLYPDIASELEEIARQTFALDNVEIASHTFSHPFFWDDRIDAKEKLYGDSLPVPNYTLDYDREVFGSVRYINEHLAPKHKQVEVFLWSGMADPTADVIAKTRQLDLYNVNGGNTYVLNDNYSIAQVYPHLNWYKDGIQVYAAVMNENLYTELWTENYRGFARASETFELLGAPRRLKPVSIYYHMYSGVYPASLGALDHLYDWVEKHELTPLYLSEYAHRARTLYETGVARAIDDDNWHITSTGVKSLRIASDQLPDGDSEGIAGFTPGPDGNYITLVQPRSTLSLSQGDAAAFSNRAYLAKANAVIEHWQWQGAKLRFTVLAHRDLQLTLDNVASCQVNKLSDPALTLDKTANQWTIRSTQRGRYHVELHCPGQGQ